MTEQEIISGVLTEFEGLAKHPRPSHHEKEVSDYIVARLAELGVKARQDEILLPMYRQHRGVKTFL